MISSYRTRRIVASSTRLSWPAVRDVPPYESTNCLPIQARSCNDTLTFALTTHTYLSPRIAFGVRWREVRTGTHSINTASLISRGQIRLRSFHPKEHHQIHPKHRLKRKPVHVSTEIHGHFMGGTCAPSSHRSCIHWNAPTKLSLSPTSPE